MHDTLMCRCCVTLQQVIWHRKSKQNSQTHTGCVYKQQQQHETSTDTHTHTHRYKCLVNVTSQLSTPVNYYVYSLHINAIYPAYHH